MIKIPSHSSFPFFTPSRPWLRTNVVQYGEMSIITPQKRSKTRRMSVTIPEEDGERLDMIAKGKKVSVAWVIRDAIEKYVADNVKEENRGEG
jgi:hypothetical protein